MSDLFSSHQGNYQPLAARMRPRNLDDYIGQEHLLAPGKPLREAIVRGQLHSMIYWGRRVWVKRRSQNYLLNRHMHGLNLSAVLSGVKENSCCRCRCATRRMSGRKTILFVDERPSL